MEEFKYLVLSDGIFLYFDQYEKSENFSKYLYEINIKGQRGNAKITFQNSFGYGIIFSIENIKYLYDYFEYSIDNNIIKAKILLMLMDSIKITELNDFYRNTNPSIRNFYTALSLVKNFIETKKNITFDKHESRGQGSWNQPDNVLDTFKIANLDVHGGIKDTLNALKLEAKPDNDKIYTLSKCMEFAEHINK